MSQQPLERISLELVTANPRRDDGDAPGLREDDLPGKRSERIADHDAHGSLARRGESDLPLASPATRLYACTVSHGCYVSTKRIRCQRTNKSCLSQERNQQLSAPHHRLSL